MFDGVLFDLDGTLWDATGAICASWQRVLERHPEIVRPPVTVEEVRSTMGLLLRDIARKMFPHVPGDLRDQINREHSEEMHRALAVSGGALYPGVEETLARLAGKYRLFLVSNCGDGYLNAFYAAHGLKKYFTGDLCAGRTGRPKKDNIAQVAAEYALKNPVYVGDTQLDCTSAREAGVSFLHAAYGFGTAEVAPSVAAFAQLPEALERLSPP